MTDRTETAGMDAREHADVESSTEDYARRFSGPVGAWFLDVQARATIELIRAWAGAAVLDVGGGHGQLIAPLIGAGHDVTVLGSAPSCVERVRPWIGSRRAHFVAGDLLNAPWPDRSFEVVLAFRLLPHVARVENFVAELTRLARRAVITDYPTTRSMNAVSGPLFAMKKNVEKNTRPYRVFRDAEIAAVFARRGFTITGRRPQFLLPMALHRAMGSAGLSRSIESLAMRLSLTRVFGSPVIARAERS
ncbi:MAG: methyltransferase domain-containing protein [Vicinamibacteria bacterium]|nr:methyltransferase domain-containing protein [Vicinamibacteria bacterium]